VTRVTRRGRQLGSDHLRVSAEAALRAHTYEGAVSLGREDDLGSLEVGKYADFAVLADDPLAVEPLRIAEITVLETWVGGEPRHRAA
jgi:predicted amidohydrolase YtcJ